MRKFQGLVLLGLTVCAQCIYANEATQSAIALTIESVQTARVKNHWVRTILFAHPIRLDVELIKAPELDRLLDKITIKQVNVDIDGKPKQLDFEDSAAVEISDIRIESGFVMFDVEFFVRRGAVSYNLTCAANAEGPKLPTPRCLLKQ